MARRRRGLRSAFARLKRPWQRFWRFAKQGPRRWLLAGLLLLSVLVGLTILWPARAVRAYVGEELGIRRVEVHARDIEHAAEVSGVDPYLLAAIVFVESRGRVDALSHKDAMGLMQLTAAAAADAAQRLGQPVPSRTQLLGDARLNLLLGASHITWLLAHREDWNLEQVLVAYNAGRSKLKRWVEAAGSYDRWRQRESRAIDENKLHTGSLLYAERVLSMREIFRKRAVIQNSRKLRTR